MKRPRLLRVKVGATVLFTAFGLLSGGAAAYAAPHALPTAAPGGSGDSKGGAVPEGAERAPDFTAPPEGAEEKQAPPEPAGVAPNAVGGKSTRSYGPIAVPAGYWSEAWAYCPSGARPTGGGEFNTSPGGVVLLKSTSLNDTGSGEGWLVKIVNFSQQEIKLTVYAVCVSGLSGDYIATANIGRAAPGRSTSPVVTCADNRRALLGGGGIAGNVDGTDSFNHSIARLAPSGPDHWQVSVYNPGPKEVSASTHAICAGGVENRQIVSSPVKFVPQGGYESATVTCPPGLVAVGGGFESVWNTMTATDLYPAGEGWTVYARSDIQDDGLRAVAICGR